MIILFVKAGEPVTDVQLIANAQKSLVIKWSPPLNNRGKIKEFQINVTAEGEPMQTLTAEGTASEKPVTHLKDYKNYTVTIVTVNDPEGKPAGGPGQPTVPVSKITWPARMFC